MRNGKCGCRKKGGLCPVSLGIALGLTYGLSVFLMAVTVIYGISPINPEFIKVPMTWSASGMLFLWAFIQAFVFGFVLAVIYDAVSCCFPKCCKKSESQEGCGCGQKGCGCTQKLETKIQK